MNGRSESAEDDASPAQIRDKETINSGAKYKDEKVRPSAAGRAGRQRPGADAADAADAADGYQRALCSGR